MRGANGMTSQTGILCRWFHRAVRRFWLILLYRNIILIEGSSVGIDGFHVDLGRLDLIWVKFLEFPQPIGCIWWCVLFQLRYSLHWF